MSQSKPVVEKDVVEQFARNTVILSVTFHRLGTSRLLERAALEETIKDADPESISARKKLFRDCPELKAIAEFMSETEKYVKRRALPSLFRGGVWVIPNRSVERVDDHLTKAAERLPVLVEAFVDVYEKRVEESKARLKHLAVDIDYPTVEKIRRAFGIEWRFLAFDTPAALKGISKSLWEREAQKSVATIIEAREAAVLLLREQAKECVDHMVERLTPGDDGKKKVFRDSLVANLVEYLETFGDRNEVAADAELGATVAEMRALMEGIDAETLRTEEGVRAAIVSGMAEVKAKLDTLVVVAPRREISFDEEA